MVACVAVGFTAATQYVADRLGYHPNLGLALYPADAYSPVVCVGTGVAAAALAGLCVRRQGTRRASPLLALVALTAFAAARGPIYPPARALQWGLEFHRTTSAAPGQWEQLKPIFHGAYPVGIAGFFVALCALGYAFFGTSVKYASNAHGTAEFGSGTELLLDADVERRRRTRHLANGKVTEPGVMIGRMPPRSGGFPSRRVELGRLLWYHGPSHILTMAPTRSGKGVGAVVPTLLRYPGMRGLHGHQGGKLPRHARAADARRWRGLRPRSVPRDGREAQPTTRSPIRFDTIDTKGVARDPGAGRLQDAGGDAGRGGGQREQALLR